VKNLALPAAWDWFIFALTTQKMADQWRSKLSGLTREIDSRPMGLPVRWFVISRVLSFSLMVPPAP
jgi:hypothetical protein